MMDIIDYIGKSSGIDNAVYDSTDQGTAQKLLSLSRYLLATDGQSFPGITAWQYTHPLPYEHGLSEDVYHGLFEQVGHNESLMQSFFASRLTVQMAQHYWRMIPQPFTPIWARYPKPGTGSTRCMTALQQSSSYRCIPLIPDSQWRSQSSPGNQPDVITIENALKQLNH